VSHIWDLFLKKGWKVIINIALVLLKRAESKVCMMREEEAMQFMKVYLREGLVNTDNLIQDMSEYHVTNRLMEHLEELYQNGRPKQLALRYGK
jgi:hypothetical protein